MFKKKLKKMSDNKRNFYVGIACSIAIFLMGVIYLTIPSYYGLAAMYNINANNLFVSGLLMFACVNLVKYIVVGKNPTTERVYMTVASAATGALDIILGGFYDDQHMVLAISIMVFVLAITTVKLFTIDYYHDRGDAFFYIETMLLSLFMVVGFVIAINLFKDSTIQTIMLGFLFIIIGILDGVNISIKCMLKADRFLKKIKLK